MSKPDQITATCANVADAVMRATHVGADPSAIFEAVARGFVSAHRPELARAARMACEIAHDEQRS